MQLSFPLRSAFLAFPVQRKAREEFRAVQESLHTFDILHFQDPNTAHLTLFYWPLLMEIEYMDICRKVEKIAQKMTPFSIVTFGVDTFHDATLFLSIARSKELATLKKLCPWPNQHPFVPHITIARIPNPQAFRVHEKKIRKILKGVTIQIPCDRLMLFAEAQGKKQTPIMLWPF